MERPLSGPVLDNRSSYVSSGVSGMLDAPTHLASMNVGNEDTERLSDMEFDNDDDEVGTQRNDLNVDLDSKTTATFRGPPLRPFTSYTPQELDRTAFENCFANNRSSPTPPGYEALSSDDEHEAEAGLSSPLEALPTELVQTIGVYANCDADLSRLALTSPILSSRLETGTNIWRERFLARYDYPFVRSVQEFAFAYQGRRFILRKMEGRVFSRAQWDKAEHQLLVVKDMISETYNKHNRYLPPPIYSKNLAALSSPSNAPWILEFMGCGLYGNEQEHAKYGSPNVLFDTIQVTLSHLVLSPKSPVLLGLPSSRDNYDLAQVYDYNKPLASIIARLQDGEVPPVVPFRSKKFPGLTTPPPEPPKPRYTIDMHVLLHIRNFWQRHFHEDTQGSDEDGFTSTQGIGENTYASMACSLVAAGKAPQKWDKPLQEYIPLQMTWYGHYSCLHPWPKSRQDLEERQSCAEDWNHIDPMTLQLEVSGSNHKGSYWPPVFSTIPILADAMPADRYLKEFNVKYIRGLAPFIELDHAGKQNNTHASLDGQFLNDTLPKWHPFTASRVHGFICDIQDETILAWRQKRARFSVHGDKEKEKAIPGWKHICMIIYKPSTRQLVSVLEHAEEDYGGASGTEMNFNTADIWANSDGANSTAAQPDQIQDNELVMPNTHTTPENDTDISSASTAVDPNIQATAATTTPPTEEQIETHLKKTLTRRIQSFTNTYNERLSSQFCPAPRPPPPFAPTHTYPKPTPTNLPPLWSPQHIRQLEEDCSQAQFMTWDDGTIDYAYAYEGVIIPGGKIMMGRWWRIHGVEGMGPGKEIGPDGVGVEVRPVQRSSTGESEEDDADGESGGGAKGKKRKKQQQRDRRKSKRGGGRRRKRMAPESDEDETNEHGDKDDESYEEQQGRPEKEVEYEFVTMLNGEESRAVNACKGLERGPFVFWAA